MPKLQDLQERRAHVVSEMRGLANKAEAENRDYTDAEDSKHKELRTELTALDTKIERARDLADAERAAPTILHHGRGDGNFEQRAGQFSLVKAINARLGDPVDAGFEREISQEIARRSGRKFEGIAVPDEYFRAEKRTILTSGAAADLVPTQHRADLFIDLLRSALVTGRLGATVLDGLVGDQDIPRQTASGTAQWLAEDDSITETAGTFDDVTLSPKTVGAMTSYSRRTLINAVPSIENIVRRDLAAVIANAIDLEAMIGDGSGNKPTGVIHATGVNAKTLATPSWAQVLDMIAAIQGADADIGAMGWAMTPNAVKKLRSTVKASGEAAGFLMDDAVNCAGYPVARTTALPNSGTSAEELVIFGAWSQLLIGYWSATDILVNPYETTAYAKGRVLIRAMRDCDVAVRHGASFAYADDLAA